LFEDNLNPQGEFKQEFVDCLSNHPLLIFHLAKNSIKLYTNVQPGVIYRVTNRVFGEELFDNLPLMFPIVNFIDLGITNFYDVSGCLNLMQNVVDRVNRNPKSKIKFKSAYNKSENKLNLKRGAVISLEELL